LPQSKVNRQEAGQGNEVITDRIANNEGRPEAALAKQGIS
jgi:hypothetical protein